MNLNEVVLQGRMTVDPELKTTNSGVSVCSFCIAVDKYSKDGDKADFFDVTAWKNTAEFICKYFQKGSPILIHGRLETRSYETKEGQKRKVTDVVASDVYFCGGKAEGVQNAPKTAQDVVKEPDVKAPEKKDDFEIVDDSADLPF